MTKHKTNDGLENLAAEVQADADTVKKMREEAEKKVNETSSDKKTTEAQDEGDESYDIFKVIVDSIMKVVQDPTVQKAFNSLKEKFDQLGKPDAPADAGDISKELIEVISMTISYSVVMSINYYDFELKRALERDFSACNDVLTTIQSDQLALMMKFGDLEKTVALMKATNEKS